jgi:hypothetical protein
MTIGSSGTHALRNTISGRPCDFKHYRLASWGEGEAEIARVVNLELLRPAKRR